MKLRGMRLGIATETSEGRRFDTGTAKKLTGGGKITARPPYGRRNVEWEQTHMIFLQTNHKPHFPVDDYAFRKRVKPIHFPLSFVDDPDPTKPNERQKIADIGERMKPEAPGILNWLIQGCLDYQKNGLPEPDSVKAAMSEYLKDTDIIGHFIDDRCTQAPHFSAKAGPLFHAYREWCAENNHRAVTSNAFGRYIGTRFEKGRKEYIGIGLLSEQEDIF